MKQRRNIPWKPFLFGLVICLLVLQFFREYFWIAVFFGFWMLITASMMGSSFLWDRRKLRQTERAQAEAVSCQKEERRELCRKARYLPEDREAVDAYLADALGPISHWDRQEGSGAPNIDVALMPPTETVPYWQAATVGAGAVKAESGRTELALLLPPDWEPGENWPQRILREAVQTFMIDHGGIRPGFTFKGFFLMSAGFAGAAAVAALAGRPELEPLALPGVGEEVRFYWLLPLLKPEWDYFQQRGWALAQRMAGTSLAADPRRKPWADWNWFEEDTAPFAWSETDGRFCLGLDTGEYQQELFLRAGLTGSGWDWERLVREYLRRTRPDDTPFVEYACEDWVFFAASEDEEIMRRLALGLSDMLRCQPQWALRMLAPDEQIWRGGF